MNTVVSSGLPRITVVTPSYNQATYLEATLRSVTSQGYPNLEYMVVDGGSTDGSVDIIQRYANSLTWWISEPDNGPYDAINKGFARATGEIMAWLNADDIYFPWTFRAVAKLFDQFPAVRWISGEVCFLNQHGEVIGTPLTSGGLSRRLALLGCYSHQMGGFLPQEGMFWRRDLWQESGAQCNISFQLAADFELWTRFARYTTPVAAKCLLAGFRKHPRTQRSGQQKDAYHREVEQICQELPRAPYLWKLAGRTNATNLLYRLLFLRGSSETIEYDLEQDRWVHKRSNRGALYRPFVVRRKV